MKCLVTGGSGFIGSHLCERLLDLGHGVVCLDNLITGHTRNIAHLKSNPNFTFVEHDCRMSYATPEKFDVIFHFASPASPPKYQAYPIETLEVNTQGTHAFLELAKTNKARFIFASTSEIYGDPLVHPQPESYLGNVNSYGPRACYDEAKRAGEAWVYTYFTKYSLDTRMVRIFNTYGPRMDIDDGRVITNFIKQSLSGNPLTVYGDGTQTRSFCYISDLIDAIIHVAFEDNVAGEVFNIGSASEYTIEDVAHICARLASVTLQEKHTDLPLDDPKRRKPDLRKMVTRFNWSAQIGLEEGITRTIAYFRQLKK